MKNIIIAVLIFGFSQSLAQKGILDGTVIYKLDSSNLAGVQIVLIGTKKAGVTDIEGYFEIKNIEEGTYDLTLQIIGLGQDTTRNVVIKNNSRTTLYLGLPAGNCSGNQPKNCPIDGREDDVIAIAYGLPGSKLVRKAKKGKIKLAGCILTGCDPQWFCKRHQHEY